MSSTEQHTDDAKGRIKEAAGTITGDDDLKESGERGQQAAEAKGKVDQAADKVKGAIDDVKQRLPGD